MWKCKCGVENGDNTNFCSGCGEKKPSSVKPGDSFYYHRQTSPSSPPPSDSPKPFDWTLHCSEANALNSFSDVAFIVTMVLAVVILILSSIGVDKWGDKAFSGIGFLTGLVWAGAILFIGYGAKLLLQGIAVVVEASYRDMKRN